MIRQRGVGEKILVYLIPGMLVLFASNPALSGPVGLPDSARPGAVRPEQEDKLELPKAPPTEVMDVPAVIDRPFDIDECPCTIVKQFRLLNAEDMPEHEISISDVQVLLDDSIHEQPEDGFSIGQLQEVANLVRNYYREKGLILAQVVVPVQTVEEGVVDLELFVGKLGRVLTEGNELYSSAVLEQAFGDLVGKPIYKADIEAALLRLTDYPGLTVFGVFQPGLQVGTADIVLKVQDESRFDVALRGDNHGTDETGNNRFRTVIDWNNPLLGADRLSLAVQQTYNPKLEVFKSVDYKKYFWDGSYALNAFFNANKFDIDFNSLKIHSETENAGLSIDKSFIRSRIRNLSGSFGFTKKKADTVTGGIPTNEDRLSVFSLAIDYDSVDTFNPFKLLGLTEDEGGGGINFASLELSRGINDFYHSMGSHTDALERPVGERPSRQGGGTNDTRFAAGQFTKLFGTYTRLQTIRRGMSLLFRSELQWSDDLLVPLEQYSAGGPESVRGYPSAQVLWDKAAFYSFEVLFNAPFIADKPAFDNRTWGELLQLGLFYDYAIGRVNNPGLTDKNAYEDLKSAGFGLRFNLPGSIESRLFWAWAFGGDEIGEEETNDDKRPRIWGDFTYSF